MSVKRIISDEKKAKLIGSKVHKGKDPQTLTSQEKDELLIILAQKAGLL